MKIVDVSGILIFKSDVPQSKELAKNILEAYKHRKKEAPLIIFTDEDSKTDVDLFKKLFGRFYWKKNIATIEKCKRVVCEIKLNEDLKDS